MTSSSPRLDQLADALRAISHPNDFRRIEPEPTGDGWTSFAEVLRDDAALDAAFEHATERYQGRRELTGSLMGMRFAGPAIDLAVSLYLVRGWAVPLSADHLMLRHNENGVANGVALLDQTIVAVQGDETAAGPDLIRVEDDEAVRRYIAGQLSALLAPAFDLVKARTPYGHRGLWGAAADQIAGVAARRARALNLDHHGAWAKAVQLIDALAQVQPWVRIRPRPFVSPWPGPRGEAIVAVKGACCLFFKTHAQKDEQSFCSNCPLLPDEARAPRMEQMLCREYDRLREPGA